MGYWYCDNCTEEVLSENVTFQELHDRCGCEVRFVETHKEKCLQKVKIHQFWGQEYVLLKDYNDLVERQEANKKEGK